MEKYITTKILWQQKLTEGAVIEKLRKCISLCLQEPYLTLFIQDVIYYLLKAESRNPLMPSCLAKNVSKYIYTLMAFTYIVYIGCEVVNVY